MQPQSYRLQLAAKVLRLHEIDRTIEAGRAMMVCRGCGEPVGHLHHLGCALWGQIVKPEQATIRRG